MTFKTDNKQRGSFYVPMTLDTKIAIYDFAG